VDDINTVRKAPVDSSRVVDLQVNPEKTYIFMSRHKNASKIIT
jgi:hypothetical protein